MCETYAGRGDLGGSGQMFGLRRPLEVVQVPSLVAVGFG